MNKPLITIALTCYNAEDTIERAVKSAIAQAYRPIEIVIVDDASTDCSLLILDNLAKQYSEIRLFKNHSNRGVAYSRNKIFENSLGEFVCIFDDDDESVLERIEKQLIRITEYEKKYKTDLVLCYCNRNIVTVSGNKIAKKAIRIGSVEPEPHGVCVSDYIFGIKKDKRYSWGLMGAGTLMMRKSVFFDVEPFDEQFRRGEERDFAIRASFKNAYFISVDKPLITQHKTVGVGSEKSGKISLRYRLLICDKHNAYLDTKGLYRASKAIAYSNFHRGNRSIWKARFYIILACLLSWRILYERLSGLIR